jgi:hypothetical protein
MSLSKDYKPFSGQTNITTAGTRQSVTGNTDISLSRVKAVVIRAHSANTGRIYVGAAGLVSNTVGYILDPGEALSLSCIEETGTFIDLNNIWVDTETSGNDISYFGLREGV